MKEDRIKRHTYPGHHMELLLRDVCINCGSDLAYPDGRKEFADEFSYWRETFDPEEVYDLDHRFKTDREIYDDLVKRKRIPPDFLPFELWNSKPHPHPLKVKSVKKDGKRGYLVWTIPYGRKGSYLFLQKHWNCKRTFPFPNNLADDFYPKRLPTREEYEALYDKAEKRCKKTRIYSFAQKQDLWE